VALPSAERVTARARKDPRFLARARKDPGLRSRLAADLLPKSQQQERTLQTRLNAPIVPGSKVTGRELAHRAREATTVEYAPLESELASQLKAAQQHQTDVGGWYDQYLAQIQGATQRVGAAQDQLVAGAQNLGTGIQGLGQQQTGQVLNQAAAASGQAGVPGAAPSAALAQQANQAQVAREALVGSYLGQAQQQAASTKGLTEFVGGVVAPGQKAQALTTAQRAIDKLTTKAADLAREKGAYSQKQRADIRQQEVANVVALGGLANQNLTAAANTPAAKAAAAKTQAALDVDKQNATKVGVSLKTYQAMTPAQQRKLMASIDVKTSKLDEPITDPNSPFVGKTPRQVAAMPTSQRESAIKRTYGLTHPGKTGKGAGKNGTNGKGPDWQTGGQQQTFWRDVDSVVAVAKKLGANANMTQGQRKRIGDRIMADPKNPGSLAVSVALDKIIGHLAPPNVKRLHNAGIQVKTGGVPTRRQAGIGLQPTPAGSNTTYGGGAGAGSGTR
jgi:hypothetical protein